MTSPGHRYSSSNIKRQNASKLIPDYERIYEEVHQWTVLINNNTEACKQEKLPQREYRYPKIDIKFPSKLHIDYESIFEEVRQWSISSKIFLSENEQYKRENMVKLICLCFPSADFQRTVLISKFMVIIFALDDIIEGKGNTGNDFYDSLMKHGNENKDVIALLDKCTEDTKSPLVTSFADVWEQIKAQSNISWQKKFAENFIWYLKLNKWEYNNIISKRMPPLNEYIEYRRFAGGVDYSLNFIEFSRNAFLPDDVAANLIFQRLNFIAGNVVLFVNDIYSYEKEKISGQIHNLVTLMKHEYNISDQEAIDKATDFVNDDIERFVAIEQLLPTFDGEMNEHVQKYIEGCKYWMIANYDWGFRSGRYASCDEDD